MIGIEEASVVHQSVAERVVRTRHHAGNGKQSQGVGVGRGSPGGERRHLRGGRGQDVCLGGVCDTGVRVKLMW